MNCIFLRCKSLENNALLLLLFFFRLLFVLFPSFSSNTRVHFATGTLTRANDRYDDNVPSCRHGSIVFCRSSRVKVFFRHSALSNAPRVCVSRLQRDNADIPSSCPRNDAVPRATLRHPFIDSSVRETVLGGDSFEQRESETRDWCKKWPERGIVYQLRHGKR